MSIGAGGGTVASGTAPQGQTIESLKEVFGLLSLGTVLLALALAIASTAIATWIARLLTSPKAVMRSQNKARERSRLNHATLPSSSPSPPLLPLPLQHLDEPEYPSPPPDTSPPPRSAPATAEVRPSTSKQSSSSTLTGFPQLFNRPAAPMMSQAYPFPPMRTMSTNSIGASFNSPGTGPLDRLIPSGGAPTPASVAFYPPGSKPVEVFENSDFPTPNMYELALLLHSEPGMEAFWNNLIHIATTCYKAERVTLALPSDSTDLENTPWGQKATFNIAEDGLSAGDGRVDEADAGAYYVDSDGYQGVAIPTAEEPPPNVYVDQDSGKLDLRGDLDQQDSDPVPIDTCVDGPFGTVTIGLQDTPFDSTSNSDWISVTSGASPGELETLAGSSDIDYEQDNMNKAFGSKEGVVRGKVFPTLVPLNCEADALLDETGVSRVLQRGKTVVLSREYRDVKTHFEQREKRRKDGHLAKPPPEKGTTDEKKAGRSAGLGKLDMPNTSFRAPSQPSTPLYFAGKGWRRKKTQPPNDEYTHNPVLQYYSAQQEQPLNNRPTAYEEYEQAITSPWSQSPAPSPAPRQDPSENPFFTAFPKVDEDTFNPAATSPVYSAQEPVNAIGYESSWTVIHIPLVHPCQSNSLGSSRIGTESVFGGVDDGLKQKRAPIAILSMLSPAIPYPSNLIHSLSHFAPLAATAFSLASTHSSVLNQLDQLTSMRKKRPSQRPSMIPRQMSFMSENTSQNTSPGACLGSVTSPSDTSSTVTVSNLNSPCESSGGGLRWARSDSGDLRSTSSPPRAPGSPLAGNQSDESYFGQPIFSRQTGSVVPPPLPKGSDPESYTSLETRMRMRGDEEIIPSQKGKENGYFPDQTAPQTGSSSSAETDDTTPTQVLQDRSASDEGRKLRKSLRKRPGTGSYHHSYLHSYGASTFQSLAASSSPVTAKAGVPGNKRPTNVNVYAMPPPSNRLLRIIIDSIPVHVFTSAPDTGRITWANNRMLTYRGTTAKEFMRNPWDALHPDDKDEYLRRWGIAIRKGESFSHEMRVRRFDGVYRKFMVRAVPLRDPRGVIVHWFGTNMDVEDQKKAEENAARQAKTAESEHKYRSLANSSPQIVFAATANAGITFANTQWLQYSGQTLEQAEKLGFMEHVHPADRNKCCLPGDGGGFVGVSFSSGSEGAADIAGGIEKDHEDRPTFSTQLRLKDKYGNYRWHLVRCVSVKSNADDGGLWFGTCTDINDQKLVEQTLKDANEAAQKAMESKTRFLANMSHEIRKSPMMGAAIQIIVLTFGKYQERHLSVYREWSPSCWTRP